MTTYSSTPLKLLIFDLNGVLCRKINKYDYIYNSNIPHIELPNHFLYIRPGAKQLLQELWKIDGLDIAIFSSTTYKNVNLILDHLMSKKDMSRLKFLWCRDRCSFDPYYGVMTAISKYATIKKLDSIFENPIVNWNRNYNETNILMVDDSSLKMRYNPRSTYYLIDGYYPNKKDKSLYNLLNYVKKRNDMEVFEQKIESEKNKNDK